jgi:ribosomal protein S20
MQKALDKAVQTGLMHRNTAARYKSQSAKKIQKAVVA